MTEQASLPLPFELQALPSHLGSSAVEKTMHVGSVLDMARPVTRLLLKVFPVESVRVLLKKKQQSLSIRILIAQCLEVNGSESSGGVLTCH